MRKPYAQVAMTYLRRLNSSHVPWIFVTASFCLASFGLHRSDGHINFSLCCTTLVFLSGMLWIHFREQIVHPRGLLWPDVIAPHVTVFLIINAILIALASIIEQSVSGGSALGFAAVGVIAFALAGWCAVTMTPWRTIAVIAILLAFSPDATNWFACAVLFGRYFAESEYILVSADPPVFHRVMGTDIGTSIADLFVISLALLAGAISLFGLTHLTGDDLAYDKTILPLGNLSQPRMTAEVNPACRQTRPNWVMRGAAVAMPPTPGIWRRANSWAAVIFRGQLKVGFLMAVVFILPQSYYGRGAPLDPSLMMMLEHCTVLPAVLVSFSFFSAWKYLECDSLRPFPRASFLKEIGLAVALTQARIWCLCAGACIASGLLLSNQPGTLPAIFLMLAESLPLQVFIFGALIWLLRYRSKFAAFPAALCGVLIVPLIGMSSIKGMPEYGHLSIVWLGITALALLGLALTRNAYRRWLVTDIG